MNDPCTLPAHRLAALLRERRLSAVELLGAYEQRVARLNPGLNAIIATDWEAARARARAADERLARRDTAPLLGVPMTVKDSIEVAGMPTVCGARVLAEHRPQATAPAAQRLFDAGANVFGKTNVPMFAMDIQTYNPVFGPTRNPWDPGRTPGGSSGGAAAAIAAGLTGLEVGSDLAGSIRTPAHFCGVYGHKPSSLLVPVRGHIPGPPGTVSEPDLSVVGPLARDAQDLALALGLMAGPIAPASAVFSARLPPPRANELAGYRVAAWLEDPACEVDGEVRRILEDAVAAVRKAGAQVTVGPPAGLALAEIYELYFFLMAALVGGGLPRRQYDRARRWGGLAARFGRAAPNTLPGFGYAATRSHREWLGAHERREKLRGRLEAWFRDVDILLMPVTPTAAIAHDTAGTPYERTIEVNGRRAPYTGQFMWISLATLAGLPATSAPVGRTAAGLPVGIQVVSAYGQDLSTIDFARRLAEHAGGYVAPPS
jgi:amidase